MGLTATAKALANVYWIGGSPCSGKSSIAEALAAAYGLQLYHADDAYVRHANAVTPEHQPVSYKLAYLSAEELWMRPVEEQVAEELALYHEEFPLILEDLLALPATPPVLAEGAALLPACVQPYLLEPHRAISIIPTAEFQMEHYARRAWAQDVVRACSDPEQAFRNWMQRDIRFAKHVEQAAREAGLFSLLVDGGHPLTDTIAIVEQHFRLARVVS